MRRRLRTVSHRVAPIHSFWLSRHPFARVDAGDDPAAVDGSFFVGPIAGAGLAELEGRAIAVAELDQVAAVLPPQLMRPLHAHVTFPCNVDTPSTKQISHQCCGNRNTFPDERSVLLRYDRAMRVLIVVSVLLATGCAPVLVSSTPRSVIVGRVGARDLGTAGNMAEAECQKSGMHAVYIPDSVADGLVTYECRP